MSKPLATIERWNLRLQQCNFSVINRPGKDNPADYMSQHPVRRKTTYLSSEEAEWYVNLIATSAKPVAPTLAEVIDAVKAHQTLLNIADHYSQ